MKTTKFVSIIAILAFASQMQTEKEQENSSTSDALKKACEYLWLILTIYKHVDPISFLQNDLNEYRTLIVHYNETRYLVYGNYEDWENFFLKDLSLCPMSFKFMLN